jgi:hypothetical protein
MVPQRLVFSSTFVPAIARLCCDGSPGYQGALVHRVPAALRMAYLTQSMSGLLGSHSQSPDSGDQFFSAVAMTHVGVGNKRREYLQFALFITVGHDKES